MKIEKLTSKSSNKCLNVVANHVESLRINNNSYNTVRVYDKGCIGVEGSLGSANWEELTNKATAKIAQGIAYPETHENAVSRNVNNCTDIIAEKDFIAKIEKLLQRLSDENPQFLFSNKVKLVNTEDTYSSTDGVEYSYKGNRFLLSLAIKFKGSANIMDEGYGAESENFDEDKICHDVKIKCDAFLNNLPQLQEDEVVVIGEMDALQYLINHMVAEMYFNNASMLCGKLGQKLFDEKINFTIDRSPERQICIPFFDDEGVVNQGDKLYLVKDGVFTTTLASKKASSMYNTPCSGSASASYNGVPSSGIGGLTVENTADSLSQLVQGKAIYLSMTSGGDMTPSGDFSLPSIVSFLYQDGKLVGKLPEFCVSGNIFDILGKDFIGVCKDGFYQFGRQQYFVYKAKLTNKQN